MMVLEAARRGLHQDAGMNRSIAAMQMDEHPAAEFNGRPLEPECSLHGFDALRQQALR